MSGNVTDKQLKNRGGKLQDLDEWIGILNTFKKENHRCETNCYVSLPMLEEYIEEGRLFYEIVQDTSLWLFERERDYYLGYYYISLEKDLYIKPRDMDVVVYLIGTEKKYPVKREEELVAQGYTKYRRNLEYILTSDRVPELELVNRKGLRFLKKMDLHCTTFKEEDYEAVYQLWRERIDKYSVKDMLKSRIRRTEDRKECIIIRDKKNNIAGACLFEVNGAVGFSENIATAVQGDGIGIGGVLFSGSILNIFSRGARKDCMWVWENNTESRKMTERFAQLTGKFSQQLLLKKETDTVNCV